MDRLKAFFFGTLKITLALFFAGIAIAIAVWGWNSIKENQEKAEVAPLAEAKTWHEIKMEVLEDVPVKLVTKWRDGYLHYQFAVGGYPKALEIAHRRNLTKNNVGFTIVFSDKDGFKLSEHLIPLNTMTPIVRRADGQAEALTQDGSFLMRSSTYKEASMLALVWNFDTQVATSKPLADAQTAPKPKAEASAAPAKWRNRVLWRQLNKSMSQSEVETLLGPPTKIENVSVLTFWHYGYPLGGRVTFNTNGTIYGWEEP